MTPRFQEFLGQLAAGLDEEGGAADGEVADLEGEDLVGGGDFTCRSRREEARFCRDA